VIPLMLGGEMPHWSDTGPAGGPALTELAAAARGHTLIVGPHAFGLIDAVPARQVTVLVRGVPDAGALATRYASRPGVEVCCGSLAELAAVPAYDTVLALDGLDRAGSTESDGLTWDDGLAALLAVLRPGGRLLLGCENPAGLHRLLALPAGPADEDWGAPVFDDPGRPAGMAALRDRLTAAGLVVHRDYAAYPGPRSPRALISPAAFGDPALRGFLAGALRRAGQDTEPMLGDPRPVSVRLMESDLAAQLAPGWFVVAGRGGPAAALPDAVVSSGTVHTLRRGTDGWTRTSPGGGPFPVPAGRNLLEALLAAIRGRDLPALRELITGWQGGELAGVDADALVVDGDGRPHDLGIGASGSPRMALRNLLDAAPDAPADLIAAMAGIEAAPRTATARPGAAAFREVAADRDRLARELSDLQEQTLWYGQRLADRDAELARAYRIISLLKGTVPGRAATAVRGALRNGRRVARTALSQIRRP
jgi:hypothetical protein